MDDILAKLPEHCKEGSNIWCFKGPLICFCIVEPHYPDRCLRQFGMVQSVPSSCIYSADLHKLNLKGKTDINWIALHRDHLDQWNSREQHVFVADVGSGVSDNYHQWFSSVTLPYLTRIGGGHSYTMDLLDLIDSVYKGKKGGDLLAITARARQVLQAKFSLGYYQDFPVEDRRAKENELKGKPRRVRKKGDPGVANVPRIRGKLPNISVVDEGAHLGDEGDVHLGDDRDVHLGGEGGHVDDAGGIPIADEFTCVREDELGHNDVDDDARDRSFCPRWNLLPSNDSLLLSRPDELERNDVDDDARDRSFCPRWNLLPSNDSLLLSCPDEHVVDQTPPLSDPDLNLLTQTPPHPVHQPKAQKEGQQATTNQLLHQPTHEPVHHPAKQQSVQKLPMQHQAAQHHEPIQQQQQTTQQDTAQQQVPPAEQLQQPLQREHIIQLRTRKPVERDCGTNSKMEIRKEIQPYKRRRLV